MKAKYPVDQGTCNPIGQTPFLDVDSKPDTENKEADCYQGKAVILLDPTLNPIKAIGLANPLAVIIGDGTNKASLNPNGSVSSASNSTIYLDTFSVQGIYNKSNNTYEALRTSTSYFNIYATSAGLTALWTSAVGKRWRILGGQITVSQASTTAAGPCKISLYDVNTDTGIGVTISPGALPPAGGGSIVVLNLANIGNGLLAAATNTALNINLSNAFTAGGVSVQVWGCEE